MSTAIEAQGVSRSFNGRAVVSEAHLTVAPGEITALVGPNDKLWWILAMNPYVVVGDMVASARDESTDVGDLFSGISYATRSLQIADDTPADWSDCPGSPPNWEGNDVDTVFTESVPVWWIGLTLQAALAGAALWGGYARLRTPAKTLPKGSRVA